MYGRAVMREDGRAGAVAGAVGVRGAGAGLESQAAIVRRARRGRGSMGGARARLATEVEEPEGRLKVRDAAFGVRPARE